MVMMSLATRKGGLITAYLKFIEFKIGIPAAAAFVAFKGRAIICSQIRRVTVRIIIDPTPLLEF